MFTQLASIQENALNLTLPVSTLHWRLGTESFATVSYAHVAQEYRLSSCLDRKGTNRNQTCSECVNRVERADINCTHQQCVVKPWRKWESFVTNAVNPATREKYSAREEL